MTELSFAKSFLAQLSELPRKYPADYVEDSKNLPARTPYTLPRTLPDFKRPTEGNDGADVADSASVKLTIKPLRPNPSVPPLTLEKIPLSATVLSLKIKYSSATDTSSDRIKLLMKARPLADDKTLNDLGFEEGADTTLTVMITGGGGAPVPVVTPEPEKIKVQVLQGKQFWKELKVFLEQKLSEEGEEDPAQVLEVFKKAWEAK